MAEVLKAHGVKFLFAHMKSDMSPIADSASKTRHTTDRTSVSCKNTKYTALHLSHERLKMNIFLKVFLEVSHSRLGQIQKTCKSWTVLIQRVLFTFWFNVCCCYIFCVMSTSFPFTTLSPVSCLHKDEIDFKERIVTIITVL